MINNHSTEVIWRKSSRSLGGDNECVEVAFTADGVLVRDSRHRDGPTILLSREAWRALMAGLRAGRLNGRHG